MGGGIGSVDWKWTPEFAVGIGLASGQREAETRMEKHSEKERERDVSETHRKKRE